MPDDETPVGQRLGSQRLYGDDFEAEKRLASVPPIPEPPLEKRPLDKPPERRHKRQKPPNPPHQPTRERPPASERAPVNWREFVSNSLEMAGILAITTGSWLIRAWLGLIVLGLCLILLGVATGIQRSE
jgi:hypothetical protein